MRIVNRFEEDLDTRHVISDAIAAIFSAFDQKLEDLELEKLEVPMATELAMAKLHKLIDLATMAYDGIVNPEEIFERMTPDGEPYPDKIDSWARGIGKNYFMLGVYFGCVITALVSLSLSLYLYLSLSVHRQIVFG